MSFTELIYKMPFWETLGFIGLGALGGAVSVITGGLATPLVATTIAGGVVGGITKTVSTSASVTKNDRFSGDVNSNGDWYLQYERKF